MTRRPVRDAADSRLTRRDLLRVGGLGLRSRRVRALLSALGISIGIAAIVGVLGISQSSESGLLKELDQLGNLITVQASNTAFGQQTELPTTSEGMVSRIGPVTNVTELGAISDTYVYRNSLVPAIDTNGISLSATDAALPDTLGATIAHGTFLNGATTHFPAVVLGAESASLLGINDLANPTQVWIAGHWFTVVGILNPVQLVSQMDSMAFIGFPIAEQYFAFDGHPTELFLRATPGQVTAVADVLPATVDPSNPSTVAWNLPSDILKAEVVTQGATTAFSSVSARSPSSSGASASRTSWSSRSSNVGPRSAYAGARCHPAPRGRAVLGRGDPAVAPGRRGRHSHRRGGDRHLRGQPALVGDDPPVGPLRRGGCCPGHRGRRRPVPVHASCPPVADGGVEDGVS